jgi:hypothetical protein
MSSTESTLVPTDPWRKIHRLVLGHLVVGLMGTLVAYFAGRSPTLRAAVFIGIVLSETSLLGIWGSLGLDPWWRSMIGVVVGVGYLGLLLSFSIGGPVSTNYFVVSLGTLLIVGVLLVFRRFRVKGTVVYDAILHPGPSYFPLMTMPPAADAAAWS